MSGGSGIDQGHPAQLSAKEIAIWPLDYSTSPPQDEGKVYKQFYAVILINAPQQSPSLSQFVHIS